ncbi:MAG: hypothetical protein H6R18_2881, partial [Proteobacteria bacterium]|nr:hypothetical protein [Pseudomonadota bacterium]
GALARNRTWNTTFGESDDIRFTTSAVWRRQGYPLVRRLANASWLFGDQQAVTRQFVVLRMFCQSNGGEQVALAFVGEFQTFADVE